MLLGTVLVSCAPPAPATGETSLYDKKVSAAETTLIGQDHDQNRVRDDVDAHLQTTYAAGESRQMAQRYAQSVQQQLSVTSVEQAMAIETKAQERLTCLIERSLKDWEERAGLISALTLNTSERTRMALSFRTKLEGQMIDIPETLCDPSL